MKGATPLAPAALLTTLLFAFALRLYGLGSQELRGDEAFGYFFMQQGYGDLVPATLSLQEPHPVASYFLHKAWLDLAGDSEFALRFFSLWWGTLAVALLWRLGRRLGFTHWAANLAAIFMAVSPYALWHAQDARMYTMSLALTITTVIFAVEALQRGRWPWAAAYIGTALLALHTHYFAVFVVVALNLFVVGRAIFVPRTRGVLGSWLLWQLILAALYLPWFARAGLILANYGGNGDSPDFFAAATRSLSVFAVGESGPSGLQLGWSAVAGALLILGALRLAVGGATERRTLALLALYFGVPILATWWSAQSRPLFNERYLVAAAAPFYLLAAAGIAPWPFRRRWSTLLKGLALGLSAISIAFMFSSVILYFQDPAFSKNRGWRDLAAAITQQAQGMDVHQVRVAENYPDPTLWYYYRGPVEHLVLPPAANDAGGAQQVVEALARRGVARVILPLQPAANWDSASIAAGALASQYDRIAQSQVGVWPVQIYAQPIGALTPVSTTFANGVTLSGVSVSPGKLTPGGLLAVHLDWRGDAAAITGAEKVFVHLLDANGALIAQDDRPLTLTGAQGSGTGLAAYGIWTPPDLAPGNYQLIAGLYDPGQPGAPRLRTADGAEWVTLGELGS